MRGTKGGAIIGLGVALAVALLGFAASFALADPGNGNGPPPTVPGSPAYVGKASSYKVDVPDHGFEIDLQGHNAVQGSFRFEA